MQEMGPQEFGRRLRAVMERPESRFAFFLGAGCSVSSGIPAAGTLVGYWLPQLKRLRTGSDKGLTEWVEKAFPGYSEDRAGHFYGEVIENLFLSPEERQAEIEGLTETRDPGFGYAVLAQLITHPQFGAHTHVVLTTNFDDLVADALYIYTNRKPIVIVHESLVGFVRVAGARPLVIKLHGDARLAPKNTELETQTITQAVTATLAKLLADTGLIFVGYGGNDRTIAKLLATTRPPWGVFWVNQNLPGDEMASWLEQVGGVWVRHRDFDELMLLLWHEFGLTHPEEDRFRKVFATYAEVFETLREAVAARPESPEREALEVAADSAIKAFGSWTSVWLEASKHARTDPDRTDAIYRDGVRQFPNSKQLLNAYALFLKNVRKDYDRAEDYYLKALEADPRHAGNLSNYAVFLKNVRKDYDRAEEYYRKALEADPRHARNLVNYAVFLEAVRKDYDRAEEYYRKALEADPRHAVVLADYANFMHKARGNIERAEQLYRDAMNLDPADGDVNGNYAGFLLSQGREEEGLALLSQAIQIGESSDDFDLLLECYFYAHLHSPDHEQSIQSLGRIKDLIRSEVRSFSWDFNPNIQRAVEEGYPNPRFLTELAHVINDEKHPDALATFPEWRSVKS